MCCIMFMYSHSLYMYSKMYIVRCDSQVLMGQMQCAHSIVKFNSWDATKIKFIHTCTRTPHAIYLLAHTCKLVYFSISFYGCWLCYYRWWWRCCCCCHLLFTNVQFHFTLISKLYQKLKIVNARAHTSHTCSCSHEHAETSNSLICLHCPLIFNSFNVKIDH